MKIVYRLHTPEDEPELFRLWSEHSGWDAPGIETWKRRLLNSPFGETPIAVAVEPESGHILAQLVFIPYLLIAGDREVKALRPFAPIIAHTARTTLSRLTPKATLPLQLYLRAIKELRRRGYGLIYTMPDPRWRRFLSIIPDFQVATFPLWSLRLPLQSTFSLATGFTAAEAHPADPRVNELWRKSKRQYPCSVVRDSRFWSWKPGLYGYRILAVERNGELMGLVGSLHKGERQWLVCDILAADSKASLKATLCAACNLAHSQAIVADSPGSLEKVAVLVTPLMEPVIKDLGFYRDDYDFSLFTHTLDRTLAKEDVDPARWYVCATD